MGQDPSEIRQQIAQTRDEMGDTIDALGYKADVPARAKDKVTGTVDRARDSVAGTVDSLKGAVTGSAGSARDAAPSRGDVAHKAQAAVGVAQSNPLGLAIGSVAAGFLIGTLLPATRAEDRRIGGIADEVKAHASEVGQEAVEHGKQVAKEVAQTAAQTAGESAAKHGEELRETAGEHVDAVTGDPPSRV
jgi:predicted transcriptional regulator